MSTKYVVNSVVGLYRTSLAATVAMNLLLGTYPRAKRTVEQLMSSGYVYSSVKRGVEITLSPSLFYELASSQLVTEDGPLFTVMDASGRLSAIRGDLWSRSGRMYVASARGLLS